MISDHFALGYIDPVSGTLIIQLVVAGVVGAIAFCRRSIWNSAGWIFGSKLAKTEKEQPHETDGEGIEK